MKEIEKLSNRSITLVEFMAEKLGAVPGQPCYQARVGRIHNMLRISNKVVDAIIRKDIGEQWKPIPGYENYKVSNFGRIMGLAGDLVTPYLSKAGVEIFDPYMPDGRRRHLAIKTAIARAFFGTPKGQSMGYREKAGLNSVYNLKFV